MQNIGTKVVSSRTVVLSKQSSDSSIIYLGSFRKIPELINLEEINELPVDEKVQSSNIEVISLLKLFIELTN